MNKPPVLSDERAAAYEKITAEIHDHLYINEDGRLFDKLFKRFTGWVKRGMKAQRDADVAYYEPLIQTDAISYTQGVLDGERKVTNEIFEKIEKTYGLNHYDDEGKAELYVIQIIHADAWQSLKDEYPKNKSL